MLNRLVSLRPFGQKAGSFVGVTARNQVVMQQRRGINWMSQDPDPASPLSKAVRASLAAIVITCTLVDFDAVEDMIHRYKYGESSPEPTKFAAPANGGFWPDEELRQWRAKNEK